MKLALLSDHLQEHLGLVPSLTSSAIRSRRSIDSASVLSMTKMSKVFQRNNSSVIIERLPSFIFIVSQLTEVDLSHVPSRLLESLGFDLMLLRELPLQSNLEKLMDKMPSVWKKVSWN